VADCLDKVRKLRFTENARIFWTSFKAVSLLRRVVFYGVICVIPLPPSSVIKFSPISKITYRLHISPKDRTTCFILLWENFLSEHGV
jgi:hypothetical protein